MDVCVFLTYAINALEMTAPNTPNKYDDFALLGLKLVQSRICSDGPDLVGSELSDDPEMVKRAEALADIIETAYKLGCDCDDCDC